jgi:hypothetical protein
MGTIRLVSREKDLYRSSPFPRTSSLVSAGYAVDSKLENAPDDGRTDDGALFDANGKKPNVTSCPLEGIGFG